jgi:ribosomal protein S18 acetylase RimI-like enzyme
VQSPEPAEPVGRAATQADLAAVDACLASAFFEDPLWGHSTFPDEGTRRERLTRLLGSWAAAALPHSWVRITDAAEAVAVWIPPGKPEMTPVEEERFDVLLDELLGSRAPEIRALLELFEEHHPAEPAYYLSLWGVHRDHAGRGLGTVLLRDCLARIDAELAAAYLESTNPVNVPRYEALGFERHGEFARPGGPVVTTMWREPRRGAVSGGSGQREPRGYF